MAADHEGVDHLKTPGVQRVGNPVSGGAVLSYTGLRDSSCSTDESMAALARFNTILHADVPQCRSLRYFNHGHRRSIAASYVVKSIGFETTNELELPWSPCS